MLTPDNIDFKTKNVEVAVFTFPLQKLLGFLQSFAIAHENSSTVAIPCGSQSRTYHMAPLANPAPQMRAVPRPGPAAQPPASASPSAVGSPAVAPEGARSHVSGGSHWSWGSCGL